MNATSPWTEFLASLLQLWCDAVREEDIEESDLLETEEVQH